MAEGRDALIDSAADSAYMAQKVPDTNGCYVVPAFTGLGAPTGISTQEEPLLELPGRKQISYYPGNTGISGLPGKRRTDCHESRLRY